MPAGREIAKSPVFRTMYGVAMPRAEVVELEASPLGPDRWMIKRRREGCRNDGVILDVVEGKLFETRGQAEDHRVGILSKHTIVKR